MTSETDESPARAIPFMMAAAGSLGVDSSLNISILPSRMTTKSVNVPPVSTPILEIDLRDILDKFRNNRFDILNRPLRIALPCEGLEVRAHCIESMNCDFAHPREVLIGWALPADVPGPFDDLLAPAGIGVNLQGRSFARVNPELDLGPPTGFDHFQLEHRLENVHGRKITARDRSLRNARFAAVASFE